MAQQRFFFFSVSLSTLIVLLSLILALALIRLPRFEGGDWEGLTFIDDRVYVQTWSGWEKVPASELMESGEAWAER